MIFISFKLSKAALHYTERRFGSLKIVTRSVAVLRGLSSMTAELFVFSVERCLRDNRAVDKLD